MTDRRSVCERYADRQIEPHALLGTWRIVETDLWDVDDLDLMEPAHVTLKPSGHGRLGRLAIEVELDYRVVRREGPPAVEFSFEGFDAARRANSP